MSDFKHITTSVKEGVTVVTFNSARLISDYPIEEMGNELFELVEKDGVKKLLIDLSKVTYMCSSALSRFVLLQNKSKEYGCDMKIADISPILNQIFTATGMYRLMAIYESYEEGMASFQKTEAE